MTGEAARRLPWKCRQSISRARIPRRLEIMLQRQLSGRERPWVLPLFVDREARRRKARVGKRAHRDGHETWRPGGLPVNRRGAHRTETESGARAAIAEPRPLRRAPLDPHEFARKARLRPEDVAGALLAFKAMAYGDANRLALACEAKLSAAARRYSGGHCAYPSGSRDAKFGDAMHNRRMSAVATSDIGNLVSCR